MGSNMPILWQNAMSQFRAEIARKAWLWFAETRGEGLQYAADRYASEVETLVTFVRPILHGDDETMDDLMRFILRRHANHRLGSNVRPDYLEAA